MESGRMLTQLSKNTFTAGLANEIFDEAYKRFFPVGCLPETFTAGFIKETVYVLPGIIFSQGR